MLADSKSQTSAQRPITAVIDVINFRAGQIIALLMIPLIAVVVYEVVSRNLDSILIDAGFAGLAKALHLGPTLWVYDMSRMIAGVLWMAAAGYGLMRGVHIRADFLYRNWTEKTQATVDATLYLLFFMPSMIFFTWVSTEFWWSAFSSGETNQVATRTATAWTICTASSSRSSCTPTVRPVPKMRRTRGTRRYVILNN